MRIHGLTVAELERADLADVVEASLARDGGAFRSALATVDRAPIARESAEFAAVFGWTPPRMTETWLAIESALPTHESAACWTAANRSLALDFLTELPDESERGEFLARYAEGLFAGLFQISEDASGDRSLASLLPGGDEPPVLAVGHQRGQLGRARALKSFLVEIALSDSSPAPNRRPGCVGVAEYLRVLEVLGAYDVRTTAQAARAAALHQRVSWTFRLLWDASAPGLERDLALAPSLDDWERERAGPCEAEPALLNYWLVAHLLLGNAADAAEAAIIARRSPAAATRWLGTLAERILAGDRSAEFGLLGQRALETVRQTVRRAASAGLVRP